MSVERRNWLEAKLSKDRSDLIALLDPEPQRRVVVEEIDCESVKQIIRERGLDFIYQSISALPSRTEAIRRYSTYRDVGSRDIERWIGPLKLE